MAVHPMLVASSLSIASDGINAITAAAGVRPSRRLGGQSSQKMKYNYRKMKDGSHNFLLHYPGTEV